jgi:hypothetical protein
VLLLSIMAETAVNSAIYPPSDYNMNLKSSSYPLFIV